MNALSELVISDAASLGLFKHEQSMAWPGLSADGVEQSSLLVATPNIRRSPRLGDDLVADIRDIRDIPDIYDDTVSPLLAPVASYCPVINETSVPIEIWEGVVSELMPNAIAVVLRAKLNKAIPDHAMEIDISEVQPQDLDLVVPGAVFYLTMYRETTRRTVKNVQEIRFRREPTWTRAMVSRMSQMADEIAF